MNNLNRLESYKYVVYDFDLTIAKVEIDWSDWHKGIEKIIQKFDPEFRTDTKLHQILNDFIHKYGKPIRDEFFEFHKKYEIEKCKGATPNNDLINFIKTHPNISHNIFTSQSRELLNKLLVEIGLEGYFDKIVARDDLYFIKPDPEGLNLIISPNSNKSDYIMVGDSSVDEGAARNAGIDFELIDVFGKVY